MTTPFAGRAVEALSETEASRELRVLASTIKKHDEAYYLKDEPSISDGDYDALRIRNKAIEERFPHLKRKDSPEDRVGASSPGTGGFTKVQHSIPMLSLGNAFEESDVVEFVTRIRRFLTLPAGEKVEILAEPKIDGLSCSLRYEGGELVLAATRGDGTEGENITANIKTIANIPHKLTGSGCPNILEVRGEVYMDRHDFQRLNEQQAAQGGKVFCQPAQCGCWFTAPERCRCDGSASPEVLCLRLGRNLRTLWHNHDGMPPEASELGLHAQSGRSL